LCSFSWNWKLQFGDARVIGAPACISHGSSCLSTQVQHEFHWKLVS
jgi:hypothetical protein